MGEVGAIEQALAAAIAALRSAKRRFALVACNPQLDLARVRQNLLKIRERGYDRGENLDEKFAAFIASI